MYCRHSQTLHKIQFMAFHSPLMWINAQNLTKSWGGCQFIDGWMAGYTKSRCPQVNKYNSQK
jgi:hypothetical protein